MGSHNLVRHPFKAIEDETKKFNDRFLDFMGERVLASTTVFYLSLIVPLITLPMSNTVKLIVSVIASSWFQCWALPALQKTQVKADKKRDLKADADHEALTHITDVQVAHSAALEALDRKLTMLLHPASQETSNE